MTTEATFPVLKRPPIAEVVCGVHFDPVPLDGMVLGVYWDQRKDEFPEHSLQPALSDGAGFFLGNPPLRAVLVGSDKVHVLQAQHDRFFMNWRAMGETYPRFSNRGGGSGLLDQAVTEFEKLKSFCQARFPQPMVLRRVELAKIDLIESPKHWEGLDDLAFVMPITGTFGDDGGGTREFAVRFVEHDAPENLFVSVNSIADKPGGIVTAVRIETRAVVLLREDSLEVSFQRANRQVNQAFFKLINPKALERFGVEDAQP